MYGTRVRVTHNSVEGYGSNTGNSFILLSSDFINHHNAFFPPGSPRQNFILTDAAFRRCRFKGPMFKGLLARTPELQIAAKLYNEGRVRVEHRIGREKARFPSLRCILVFVRDATSNLLAVQWCVVCSVLHNIATIHRDLSLEPNPAFDDIVPPPHTCHSSRARSNLKTWGMAWSGRCRSSRTPRARGRGERWPTRLGLGFVNVLRVLNE
jgi:hypothetical protein